MQNHSEENGQIVETDVDEDNNEDDDGAKRYISKGWGWKATKDDDSPR